MCIYHSHQHLQMACHVHAHAPTETCAACRQKIAGDFSQSVMRLGPRTADQLKALETAMVRSVPWFKLDRVQSKLTTLKTGLVAHRAHAAVIRVAATQHCFVAVGGCVTADIADEFVECAHADKAIQVRKDAVTGELMVRRATPHKAYSKDTLVQALLAAGAKGISRIDIAREYDGACLDLESLPSDTVYMNAYHAWHRLIAPKRTPGLRERAQALGLIPI